MISDTSLPERNYLISHAYPIMAHGLLGFYYNLPNGNTGIPDKFGGTARTKQAHIQRMQALCKVDKTSLVIDGEDGCQKAIRLSVLPFNRWLLKAFAYQSSETFQTEDRIQFC